MVELGAALKFVSNADLVMGWGIFSRQVVLVSWAVLCGVIAVYVVARRPLRLAVAGGFAAFGLWLVVGLDGRPLGEIESFLPPRAEDTPAGALAMAGPGRRARGTSVVPERPRRRARRRP